MITFEKAFSQVIKHSKKLKAERVAIEKSVGRIIAEDICSDIPMPPFDKSAMDGYAVRGKDIFKVPCELNIIEEIQAGKIPKKKISKGECAVIMTGALIPKGADTVVMVEYTKKVSRNSKTVKICKKTIKGKNICKKGEDVRQGERVIRKGKCINSADVALLASVGKKAVLVYRKPKVSVLATGTELVDKVRKPRMSQIRNSNGPMLMSLLSSLNINAVDLGIAKDTIKDLKTKIKKGLLSDVFILSGGVSLGQYDFVPQILKELRVKNIFHNVALKPGKPLFFGRYKNTLVFGCPGNPVSTLTSFMLLIKMAIRKMMGEEKVKLEIYEGIIDCSFSKRGSRKAFYPVVLEFKGGMYRVVPVAYNGSADIGAIAGASGFMIIEKDVKTLKKGQKVSFIKI